MFKKVPAVVTCNGRSPIEVTSRPSRIDWIKSIPSAVEAGFFQPSVQNWRIPVSAGGSEG